MKPIDSLFIFMGISFLNAQTIVINEIDADSPGADTAEFIELYSSTPNLALDGYVLVLFNGADDASYAAYDLDGYSTDVNGFFVIGDSGVNGVSFTFSSSSSSNIQNDAEAVALYLGNKADFPTDTPATTSNLIDAVVYDSDDPDDTGLLTGLGKTVQYNENASSDAPNHSLQRQAYGSFKTSTPSPNMANAVLSIETVEISGLRIYPNPVSQKLYIEGLTQSATVSIHSLSGQCILNKTIRHSLNVSHLATGIYMLRLTHKGMTLSIKLVKQ
jgi:hypothetical protein